MHPSKFESRGVLDRIEETGIECLSPSSRATLTYLSSLLIVGKIGVLVLSILSALLITGVYGVSGLITAVCIGIVLAIILLIVYSIVIGIGEIVLYQIHAGNKITSIEEGFKRALPYIGSWAWFTTWQSLIIFACFLTVGGLGYGLYITGVDQFSIGVICSLFTLGITGFMVWLFTGVQAGKPGYILENSRSFGAFIDLNTLTTGRWWRVYINAFVALVIVGLGGGVVYEIIDTLLTTQGVFGHIAEFIKSMPESPTSELLQKGISDLLSWQPSFLWILSYILQVIVGSLLQIFLWKFGAITYSDITTPGKI